MDSYLFMAHTMLMQHHAFLYTSRASAESFLTESQNRTSEDVTHVQVEMFGIDDARALTQQSIQRPLKDVKRTFVIITNNVTSEAQNALLKLFEEPPETAEFHLVLPKGGLLLPTLMSRLSLVDDRVLSTIEINEVFDSFMAATYGDRLSMITEYTKAKDTTKMELLVRGAEHFVHATKNTSMLKTISFLTTYFGARGSSSKMLLEALAVSLPKT